MSDHPNDEDRDRPLTSAEMIEQAREAVHEEPDIEGLDNIAIDIPVADEFPDPIPELRTRPPEHRDRPRRVISAYDTDHDPFDRDERPVNTRAIVVALTALILLAIGGVIAFVAATNGL